MTTQLRERATARTSVAAFAEELFGPLPRTDQRRWAQVYVQGLLTTPGKKTTRRLAASVSDSRTASQALHQFVNASPWEWAPIRAELARWVEQRTEPRAWTIGLAVVPKRGEQSCGVHRRFVPQAGRTVNCQVGIGAFLSTDTEDVPVDWRLLLPDRWYDDPQLRRQARIPDTARRIPPEAQALDLIDSLATRGSLAKVPVVADLTGYADTAEIVRGLVARRRHFVVALPGTTPVLPERRLPVGGRADGPAANGLSANGLGANSPVANGPSASGPGTNGLGTNGPGADSAESAAAVAPIPVQRFLSPHRGRPARTALVRARGGRSREVSVLSGLVRLPGARPGEVPDQALRVFAEWDPVERGFGRMWITNLVNRPVGDILALADLHNGTADTVERLESDFGLRAFEGRSFPGWHHHMTLISAAFAYSILTENTDRL
ncbi:transposase [Streptomyces sp. XD-27]|uniref:IS701 family transposase n=1 Tax=Streptomyces sp. XD-27 TaxID=3062779 RepID=UPI0026F45AB5|nr:transposase [Streptomyces sp. XD-27]WKX71348.1 transposase [Streptomyces sp. XD-27]